jgi:hypothetical protein
MRCVVTHFIFAVSLALVGSSSAQAWNSAGHRIIADIAYDVLDDSTRAKAVLLIKESPRFIAEFVDRMPANVQGEPDAVKDRWYFQQSSIWADLIRGNKEYSIEKWHYINLPLFLNDLDEKTLKDMKGIPQSTFLPESIDPAVDPGDLNAVQAVQLCLQRIASPATPRAKKATYLLWVMHIVGDIHQPLHSTSLYTRGRFQNPGGDRGGNSIRTKQNGNLHALWDGLLGSSNSSLNNVRGRAQKMVANPVLRKMGEDSAGQVDPAVWVGEGHAICKQFAYCQLILDEVQSKEANPAAALASLELPTEYLTKAGGIAEERAMQAAYRLAEVLKKHLN